MIVVVDTILRIVKELLTCTSVAILFFVAITGWEVRRRG
jgi:hypothetical protein